jgi:hypothetical protein
LKGEFALDIVPTNHYGANSAWQQLSVLAHNLIRSFQLDTGAEPKRRSQSVDPRLPTCPTLWELAGAVSGGVALNILSLSRISRLPSNELPPIFSSFATLLTSACEVHR